MGNSYPGMRIVCMTERRFAGLLFGTDPGRKAFGCYLMGGTVFLAEACCGLVVLVALASRRSSQVNVAFVAQPFYRRSVERDRSSVDQGVLADRLFAGD